MLRACMDSSADRNELWARFVTSAGAAEIAEIGVGRGDFAVRLLADCDCIAHYFMVDPWRHLADWNKPANTSDDAFEQCFREALDNTERYKEKRVVLRGTTVEVIDEVPDGALDFAYVDGDHTLRGITVDLARVFPKIREGGWIGGDDFCRSIWQHDRSYEPTLVFPYAVHFAEAVGARVYGLPHNQFLIEKSRLGTHEFVDLAGVYGDLSLRTQIAAVRLPRRASSAIGGYLRSTVRFAFSTRKQG